MKLEWDELSMILHFIQHNPELWRAEIEREGFDFPVAQSIQARLTKMTQDEQTQYFERFGPQKQVIATGVMQVTKGEKVLDIILGYNHLNGWYASKVPGVLAFVLLSTTLEAAQKRLEDQGWKWNIL